MSITKQVLTQIALRAWAEADEEDTVICITIDGNKDDILVFLAKLSAEVDKRMRLGSPVVDYDEDTKQFEFSICHIDHRFRDEFCFEYSELFPNDSSFTDKIASDVKGDEYSMDLVNDTLDDFGLLKNDEADPRFCAHCDDEFTPSKEHEHDLICDECVSEKGIPQRLEDIQPASVMCV